MTIKDFKVLEKLPSTIIPFGLGDRSYPSHWMNEKSGKTIMNLNKFYGETTGMYWLWKNYLKKLMQMSGLDFANIEDYG